MAKTRKGTEKVFAKTIVFGYRPGRILGRGFPREYCLWIRLGKVLGKGNILLKNPQCEWGAHRCGWKETI